MRESAHNTESLQQALGQVFQHPELLEQALTHASYAREAESHGVLRIHPDNEQMEFLGDAVLSFVVSQELFRRFPEYRERTPSRRAAAWPW